MLENPQKDTQNDPQKDIQDGLDEWTERLAESDRQWKAETADSLKTKFERTVEEKKYDSAIEWERYAKRYGTSGVPSFAFKPGERIDGTLLTVVGPGYVNRYGRPTWKSVIVRCDCGREVAIPRRFLSRDQSKYSCGCVQRTIGQRWNEKDYANLEVSNRRTGRTLTVLHRDPVEGWIYVCSCCARRGVVPIGLGLTIRAKLKKIAGEPCEL